MLNRSLGLGTKNHFHVLDGLRGVAALVVVLFHSFEMYSNDNPSKLLIGHGYLAVDFFFLLSGFVVAYAYDDRWDRMSIWAFFKRRMVRLQPMVIMGNIFGAALFYTQVCPQFAPIAATPVWKLILVMLIGFTVIPITPSVDIRGWEEMHPLNGAEWSLFFEYLANIAYALVLRRLSNKVLGVVVFLSALLLIHLTVFGSHGDVIGGWTVARSHLHIGFTRLFFPFMGGMLLMRMHKRIHVPHGFLWCSILLVALFSMPRVGPPNHHWMNGVFESFCIIVIFPLIVLIGAGTDVSGKTLRACTFLGDLSYPLYISHYPLNYTYTAWVYRNHVPVWKGWPISLAVVSISVSVGYAVLKLYDEPVRAWLGRTVLRRTPKPTPVVANI